MPEDVIFLVTVYVQMIDHNKYFLFNFMISVTRKIIAVRWDNNIKMNFKAIGCGSVA